MLFSCNRNIITWHNIQHCENTHCRILLTSVSTPSCMILNVRSLCLLLFVILISVVYWYMNKFPNLSVSFIQKAHKFFGTGPSRLTGYVYQFLHVSTAVFPLKHTLCSVIDSSSSAGLHSAPATPARSLSKCCLYHVDVHVAFGGGGVSCPF